MCKRARRLYPVPGPFILQSSGDREPLLRPRSRDKGTGLVVGLLKGPFVLKLLLGFGAPPVVGG